MASRETRRLTKKKDDHATQKTQVDKRKEKQPLLYIGSIVVFAIIAITFIGGGFFGANAFQNQPRMTFGSYNGKSIYYDLYNYFGMMHRRAADQNSSNDQSSNIDTQTRQIWQEAFYKTVKHEAVLDKALASGYHVTEKAIDKALLNYPYYLDEDGKFDEKRYKETSKRIQDAARELKREELIEIAYYDDVLYSRYYSKGEMDFYKNMFGTERAFRFSEFNYTDYPDEKVLEYGNTNQQDFKKKNLSRILMVNSNIADANQILDKINSNLRSFEDLAREYSSDVYADLGGDMGTQYFYQIRNFFEETEKADQLANEVFNLQNGNTSAPIQVGENWVFFRANSEAENANLEDTDTIAAIRDYLLNIKRGEVEDYMKEQATTFASQATATSLEEAARAITIPVYETEYFPINYLSVFYGKPIQVKDDDTGLLSSAADNDTFFETAFSLETNEVSAPITLDDKIIVLQLIAEKPLDEAAWAEQDNTWRTFIGYQSPNFLDLFKGKDISYTYLFMAGSYFQDELGAAIVDQKKLKDEFNVSFNKYFSPGI